MAEGLPETYRIRRRLLLLSLAGAVTVGGFAAWQQIRPKASTAVPGAGPQGPMSERVVEWAEQDEEVGVALYVADGTSTEEIRSDIVGIYDWSQQFHDPVHCGGMSSDTCKVGITRILLLFSSPILLTSGQEADAYVVGYQMELDQFHISQLLVRPPRTWGELVDWHSVASSTGGGAFERLGGIPFRSLDQGLSEAG